LVRASAGFREQVERERKYLLRYASLQLRDNAAAEDAVQETLLAALAGESGFQARSSLRTWLTGILKHKILDAIRRASREVHLDEEGVGGAAEFDHLFNAKGHWVEHPAAWDNPAASLERKEFFAALEECLGKLPAKTATAFLMREHLGADTEEICTQLAIAPNHCWVLLYRARMALQQCLHANWFGK
jgi:RNA polymerase sigma-70 factor (ECF subfamily)